MGRRRFRAVVESTWEGADGPAWRVSVRVASPGSFQGVVPPLRVRLRLLGGLRSLAW